MPQEEQCTVKMQVVSFRFSPLFHLVHCRHLPFLYKSACRLLSVSTEVNGKPLKTAVKLDCINSESEVNVISQHLKRYGLF